jgi:hypothetical protein
MSRHRPTAQEDNIVAKTKCPACHADRDEWCVYLTGRRKGRPTPDLHPARVLEAIDRGLYPLPGLGE